MQRRTLLCGIGGAATVGLCGCLGGSDPGEGTGEPGTATGGSIGTRGTDARGTTDGTEADEKRHTSFVEADGTDFSLDGDPIRFSGANSCCLYTAFTARGQTRRDAVDEVLEDASALGMNSFRTRAHGQHKDFAYQPEPGVYDEEAMEHLDYVVHKADREGLRLVLRLTDSWDTSGATIPRYVEWSETAESHDDFYTDESCRRMYREYVEYLLNRENTYTGLAYKDDPTILMWNLCNEPFADDHPDSTIVSEWVGEMASFVKGIDPNHLVSIGHLGTYDGEWELRGPDEGTLRPRRGIDFVRDHDHPEIDVCTFHVHPQELGFQSHRRDPDTWLEFVDEDLVRWIEAHVRDARELGKPLFAEEVGWKANRSAENGDRQLATAREVLARLYEVFEAQETDGVNVSQFVDRYKRERWEQDSLTIGYPEDESLLEPVVAYTDTIT